MVALSTGCLFSSSVRRSAFWRVASSKPSSQRNRPGGKSTTALM
jgi:hypothetical protein